MKLFVIKKKVCTHVANTVDVIVVRFVLLLVLKLCSTVCARLLFNIFSILLICKLSCLYVFCAHKYLFLCNYVQITSA